MYFIHSWKAKFSSTTERTYKTYVSIYDGYENRERHAVCQLRKDVRLKYHTIPPVILSLDSNGARTINDELSICSYEEIENINTF